ncbi:MAG: hypothetical protein U1E14_06945 [Geminicoccaceae bacterium]
MADQRTALTRLYLPLMLSVLLAILVGLWGASDIDPDPVGSDSGHVLAVARNLALHGVHSAAQGDGSGHGRPKTMLREPFPSLVYAGWLLLAFDNLGELSYRQLNSTGNIERVKLANHFLIAANGVMLFLLCRAVGCGTAIALAAQLILVLCIVLTPNGAVTDLAADPVAMLLVSGFALALLRVWRATTPWPLLLPGLLLGLLALSKAIVFYAILPVAILVALCRWPLRPGWRAVIATALPLALTAFLVCTPWMVRNWLRFGEPSIALRSGTVIYYRALLNGMTDTEYAGSFFAFSPTDVRAVIGPILGYAEDDMALGAPLQRLGFRHPTVIPVDQEAIRQRNPEAAVSYRRRLDAEQARRMSDPTYRNGRSAEQARGAVEASLRADAFRIIMSDPWAHLRVSVPIIWKGLWLTMAPALLAPVANLALLAAPVIAWRRRRPDVTATTVLPLVMLAGYTLLSHFEARYANPAFAMMLMALAFALSPLVRGAARVPSVAPA